MTTSTYLIRKNIHAPPYSSPSLPEERFRAPPRDKTCSQR